MHQRWHDLLFMHWAVAPDTVCPHLPASLRPYLDLFQGSAWVGVVPFWMSEVRLRATPAVPGLSRFAELNVRTYLTIEGKPGVYFFSLDAERLGAVVGARIGFRLPYFYARMSVERTDSKVSYRSRRLFSSTPAEYVATYGPASEETFRGAPGTLEHFLVERYCLYTSSRGRISRCDIHHPPWPLQRAWCDVMQNTVAEADGLTLPAEPPVLHFASHLPVRIWWPTRLA